MVIWQYRQGAKSKIVNLDSFDRAAVLRMKD